MFNKITKLSLINMDKNKGKSKMEKDEEMGEEDEEFLDDDPEDPDSDSKE